MEFVDARALDEALTTLDERGEEATVLAGGTDVVVLMLQGMTPAAEPGAHPPARGVPRDRPWPTGPKSAR